MADAIHCDRNGCDTWSRNPEDHGFLAVNWWGDWSRLLTWPSRCWCEFLILVPPVL